MSRAARNALFLASSTVAGAVVVAALVQVTSMDDFRDLISVYYLDAGVVSRSSYNVVSSVIFDYRGFDTMIEQLILFTAVVGTTLLLRRQADEREEQARSSLDARAVPAPGSAIRVAGIVLAGFSVLVAIYIILAVHVTPGGGFQSGVLIAGGVLTLHVALGFDVYGPVVPTSTVERIEAISAGLYVLVGVAGIVVAGSLLANVLPLGSLGGLYGGGTIWVLNLIVGFEVTAGFVLLVTEYAEQTLLIHEAGG